MMKKIALFLCFLPGLLWAGEFRVLTFADYYGGIEASEGYENLRNRYQIRPEYQGSLFGGAADFKIDGEFWYDPIGEEPRMTAPENILREAFVSFPAGPFDIALGQKLETFGFADLFSPLDVINGGTPKRLSMDDPYEGKRPDLMVQIQYYPNFDDTLELIYVPFPRPDWEPKGDVELSSSTTDAQIEFEAAPYTELPHSFFARYYHFAAAFDLQLVYAWYMNQSPGFDLSDTEVENEILTGTVETEYTKNHLFGAGISLPVGDIIFSEDLGFTLTEDLEGKDIGTKNSYITANSQFTGTIFDGVFAQMNIIYQYILNYDNLEDEYETEVYDDISEEFNSFYIQPVEHIAFAVVHLHKSILREKLYLGINLAYVHPSAYIMPRVAYAFSDRLKMEVGSDIYTGEPSDNDLVRGNDRDNFYLRLKYEY